MIIIENPLSKEFAFGESGRAVKHDVEDFLTGRTNDDADQALAGEIGGAGFEA